MRKIIELSAEEAREHFLKGSSYFNSDLPPYLSFEPILTEVAKVLGDNDYKGFKSSNPCDLSGVNYSFLANKDGRFAWRPFELIHPAIYVSMANLICKPDNWACIQNRFSKFSVSDGAVECCSIPVVPASDEKDAAAQIKSWWVNPLITYFHRIPQTHAKSNLKTSLLTSDRKPVRGWLNRSRFRLQKT